MLTFLKRLSAKALDTILPPICPVTYEFVDKQGMIDPQYWERLNFITEPFCLRCGVPFEYDLALESTELSESQDFEGEVEEVGAGAGAEVVDADVNVLDVEDDSRVGEASAKEGRGGVCASCIAVLPEYTCHRAALVYDEGSRDLILRFKHGDQLQAVKSFVPWLVQAGALFFDESSDFYGADYIIPVPLHRGRLLRRRYNQSALLAQDLSNKVGVPSIPDFLVRHKATDAQGKKNAKERYENVRGAFGVMPRYEGDVKGKCFVLVDDVYTTGATLNSCAKALKNKGAKAVYCLTIARTVRV